LLRPRLSRLSPGIVHLELSEREPVVLGHPGELMQIVLNLVLNALYAVQEAGDVTMSTQIKGNMVILQVHDTGIGIQEDHIPKLFEPFFTTKPPGQGIGVGLSTCYNIISKHGGYITVDSEPGRGATFEVILPYYSD
jgi:signal transduction histidine kinase